MKWTASRNNTSGRWHAEHCWVLSTCFPAVAELLRCSLASVLPHLQVQKREAAAVQLSNTSVFWQKGRRVFSQFLFFSLWIVPLPLPTRICCVLTFSENPLVFFCLFGSGWVCGGMEEKKETLSTQRNIGRIEFGFFSTDREANIWLFFFSLPALTNTPFFWKALAHRSPVTRHFFFRL